MSLVARVVKVLRANLSGHFGNARWKDAYSSYSRHDNGRTEYYWEPPPHPKIDPTLAGYYANLELPYGASREEIRSARRRLLSHYHPDRFPNDSEKSRLANHLVQRLNHAHDELIKHLEREETRA